MKLFYLGAAWLLLLTACSPKENSRIQIIREWQNKEILFPRHLQARVLGKDTICDDLLHKTCKVLVHVDSSGCTPCRLHLYQWHKIIQEYKGETEKLAFVFIVHAQNPKKLDIICQENKFNYPVFYDKSGTTNRLNRFPKDIAFHTFLLGPGNKVLLSGDPIGRPPVWELYRKKIAEYLNK